MDSVADAQITTRNECCGDPLKSNPGRLADHVLKVDLFDLGRCRRNCSIEHINGLAIGRDRDAAISAADDRFRASIDKVRELLGRLIVASLIVIDDKIWADLDVLLEPGHGDGKRLADRGAERRPFLPGKW